MKSLKNTVQLIGNLGRDVEFKKTETGKHLAKVSIATNESYKNAEGEKVEEVQWHNLTGWGKVAEHMEKFWKKGMEVAVQGKLVHRDYQDKEGNNRQITEVVVSDFLMLR
ncbi:MAG: single-stranded DNA-binding protein [Saprospiraceae bacterium]|nr:single-stranded DNA-binding protein [Saprospiraceae bacterium]